METLLIVSTIGVIVLWLLDNESKWAKIAALEHELHCRKKYGNKVVDYWDENAEDIRRRHNCYDN